MNKISILGLTAFLALGFASCDGYEEPNPAPVTNEQQSIIKPEDVVVTNSYTADQVVELGQFNNQNSNVTIATVQGVLPAGVEFMTKAEFSANGTDWYELPTTVINPNEGVSADSPEYASAYPPDTYLVTVNPDVFNGLYVANVTQDPAQVPVDVRFKLYTVEGGMNAYVNLNYYTEKFIMAPIPLGYVIEENYYLIGTASDGTVEKAVKMEHDDANGVNRYDNPNFSVVVEADGEFSWMVIPESVYAAGKRSTEAYSEWGVAADKVDALTGKLVPNEKGSEGIMGKFKGTAPYRLTVDMYNKTYAWAMAFTEIYCVGTHCKNNPANATPMATTNYSTYWGFIDLKGSFRFLSEPSNKAAMKWGAGEGEGVLAEGVTPLNHKGFSFVNVDIVKLTYKVTDIETIGLIGDATPGAWSDDTPMVQDKKNPYIWTVDVTLTDGTFKFRANNGWDVNLGGDMGNLTYDGANINVSAGTYAVTLDLSTIPMTCTLVAK